MLFNPSSRSLADKLSKLVPDIQQIVCSRFVNYLTLKISSKSQQWAHDGQLLHTQHTQSIAYLQANFKNHVVNKKGLVTFEKLLDNLQRSDNNQLLEHLQPVKDTIASNNRRNFYIFEEKLSIEQLVKLETMKNKAYNKIICFPKSNPIQLEQDFQKFCIQHHIRALGLTEFTLKSLMNQIYKTSRSSTLIHELVSNDLSFYTDVTAKGVPTQLILFLNDIKDSKLKKRGNFPTFKQIAKNYLYRQSFNQNSKPTTPNFKICRMHHFVQAKKYQDAIIAQELMGTVEGQQN